MKARFKFIPAVYLVLKKNDSVLLLRRYNTGYQDGSYSLIAGHLDGDEPLATAMAREAQEEAGIRINPEDLTLVHVMHLRSNIQEGMDNERISFYFTTDIYEGEPYNAEPHKCDDLNWFPLASLPKTTIPHVRYALENIQKNLPYSAFGWNSAETT